MSAIIACILATIVQAMYAADLITAWQNKPDETPPQDLFTKGPDGKWRRNPLRK